jgi:hypothetical protein
MADAGVEIVLREIRDRVRAETNAPARRGGDDAASDEAIYNGLASAALLRLRANLATTERAWGRLPPVTSFHRKGWGARVEIWIKRQLARATSWYFYEQINFNAAVNAALRDAADALEQSINEQRVCLRQLAIEMSEQSVVIDRARRAAQSRIDELSSQLEELRAAESEPARRQNGDRPAPESDAHQPTHETRA